LDDAAGFWLAVFVIIPLVMAAVTLLIRDRVNRYVNLITGLAYGLYGVYVVVGEILSGHFDGHILMTVVACVLGLLIAALGLIGLRQSTDRRSLRA
jgi:drug/metabolite transporter (DMT)-like permease